MPESEVLIYNPHARTYGPFHGSLQAVKILCTENNSVNTERKSLNTQVFSHHYIALPGTLLG